MRQHVYQVRKVFFLRLTRPPSRGDVEPEFEGDSVPLNDYRLVIADWEPAGERQRWGTNKRLDWNRDFEVNKEVSHRLRSTLLYVPYPSNASVLAVSSTAMLGTDALSHLWYEMALTRVARGLPPNHRLE
jgi:hypothetical protein